MRIYLSGIHPKSIRTGQIPDSPGRISILTLKKIVSGSKLRINFGLFRTPSGFEVSYRTDSDLTGRFSILTLMKIISSSKLRINFGLIRTFSGVDLFEPDKFHIQADKFQIIFLKLLDWTGHISEKTVDRTNFGRISESGMCPKFLGDSFLLRTKNLSFGGSGLRAVN